MLTQCPNIKVDNKNKAAKVFQTLQTNQNISSPQSSLTKARNIRERSPQVRPKTMRKTQESYRTPVFLNNTIYNNRPIRLFQTATMIQIIRSMKLSTRTMLVIMYRMVHTINPKTLRTTTIMDYNTQTLLVTVMQIQIITTTMTTVGLIITQTALLQATTKILTTAIKVLQTTMPHMTAL